MAQSKIDAVVVIGEFNEHYGHRKDKDVLFVSRLRSSGMSEEQIAEVILAMDDLCKHCFGADSGCHCTNED